MSLLLRRKSPRRETKPLRRAPLLSVTVETLEARLLLSAYNAAADFSATTNPDGVWSYGWSASLGSTFNLDNYHGNDVDATHVEDDWHPSDNAYPLVFYNPLSVSHNEGSNILQPGQLALHPSDTDGYAVVRFTAPSDGSASVQATFSSVSIPGATSDAYVLLDGVPLFGGPVSANLSQTFTETIAVKQGDTIDFAVGERQNVYAYDGTGLSAQITLNSPDIAATPLTWDTSQGGVDYGYTISSAGLPQATTVDLDWASGTTVDTVIGSPIISTTTATAQGTYQLHATPSQLGTPPAGATYLLVVADPDNLVSPADPSKVASLALTSIIATTPKWNTTDGGVDYGYTIGSAGLPQATTVDLDWASGTTVDTVIGSPIISTTTATAQGTYQLHATPSQLGTPPAGATYLLVVADPDNLVSPADPSKVASVPLLVTITTPDTHQVGQVANSQSAYVGVEGVDLGGPNSEVEVETLTSTGIVISSTVVGTDSSGLWDAVVLGTSSAYTVRAFDIADPTVFDSVFVHCLDKNGDTEFVDYQELQKGDLILSGCDRASAKDFHEIRAVFTRGVA